MKHMRWTLLLFILGASAGCTSEKSSAAQAVQAGSGIFQAEVGGPFSDLYFPERGGHPFLVAKVCGKKESRRLPACTKLRSHNVNDNGIDLWIEAIPNNAKFKYLRHKPSNTALGSGMLVPSGGDELARLIPGGAGLEPVLLLKAGSLLAPGRFKTTAARWPLVNCGQLQGLPRYNCRMLFLVKRFSVRAQFNQAAEKPVEQSDIIAIALILDHLISGALKNGIKE